MDSLEQTTDQHSKDDALETAEHPVGIVSMSARVWEYRGPQEKLADLEWGADDSIAELIRDVLRTGQGNISELRGSILVSQFDNPFNALTAAKALQLRLLTLQRAAGSQLVAAVVVHSAGANATSPGTDWADSLLVEANSAQILVARAVYDSAKNVPGFQFGPKPAIETGERGRSEALYELLWTDESTYSHVRKVGQSTATLTNSGAKRYEIQSELGRGAMGVVYKAIDNVIGRTVALKTISIQRNFADRAELVERLKLEAKAAGSLDHPNIITIYDVGQDEDSVYLSMQFVEGKTLAALLNEGRLPPLSTLLSYADQICSAVGFAHQRGVIHRDLKPANFMITADGAVKVLDFGIAKLGDATVTQTGVVVGTPTYMAPEQATGKKLDQRSDIFTLGTVFYELFTLEKPFKGDIAAILYKLVHDDPTPPSIVNPALPNGIDRIIRKALAKNAKDRYQTCEEMREAFREQAALLQTSSVPSTAARQPGTTAQPAPTTSIRNQMATSSMRRSSRSVWPTIAAVILIALVAVGGWAFRVKARTGTFPAAVQRAVAATRARKTPDTTSVVSTNVTTTPQSLAATPADASATTSSITTPTTASAETSSTIAPTPAPTTPASAAPENSVAEASPKTANQIQPDTQQPPPPQKNSGAQAEATGAETATASPSNTDEASSDDEPVDSAPAKHAKTHAKNVAAKAADENLRVEGFSREEIPALLRKADAAAGAGDYSVALYEYNIVLKLDRHNAAARAGIARATAAKQENLHR